MTVTLHQAHLMLEAAANHFGADGAVSYAFQGGELKTVVSFGSGPASLTPTVNGVPLWLHCFIFVPGK
jgi:hypothetical protein